jgi:hypothetical protein
MKTFSLLVALCAISIGVSAQSYFSTADGLVGNNNTASTSKMVQVSAYFKMINPDPGPTRTAIIEKDDDDSFVTFHDPGDGWFSMGIDRSNSRVFTLNSGGGLGDSPALIMTGGGDIGVGLSLGVMPDAKLAVNGIVHAKEVRVTTNVPGPDYVFEKDYNLPSLETIKSFIDQHHHLPEIPSAKEMETNGIKVGEMNMLLLKKVEELTLYMIEMKRENDSLKKTVEELSKRVN